MANQYPNSGSLFVRDKRSPKAADYGGDFTIEGEVLDYVLRLAERGQPVKLEISGWKRQGRNNTNFISLKVETPFAERQQNGGQRQPARGGYSGQGQQRGGYEQQGQRGGYADQSGGRSAPMTSQGRYPASQRGTPQNQRMREDLNDDIPFGNEPQRGGWDD